MAEQAGKAVPVLEHMVRAPEGNYVRYRRDGPLVLLAGTETFLPREFVACFPDDRGGPELHLRFEVADGVPHCREVFLQSLPGEREIRPSDVKSAADIEHLLEVACQMASLSVAEKLPGGGVMVTQPRSATELGAVARSVSRARRNTRRQIPDSRLHEVAEAYRSSPRRPTAAVADRFGLALRTASLYVRRARDAGLLEEESTDGKHHQAP